VSIRLAHLGYPSYLLAILGTAKLLGAPALLQNRFPTLREWAYAGFAFDLIGANRLAPLLGRSARRRDHAVRLPPAAGGVLWVEACTWHCNGGVRPPRCDRMTRPNPHRRRRDRRRSSYW
jgi:hypothetical protein